MSSVNQSSINEANEMKKSYDDISYEKRIKLIELIDQRRWTIRSAAAELGIKLCTAKYILYLYRRKGKISQRRKAEMSNPLVPDTKSSNQSGEEQSIQYIYVPYPVYIYCYPSQGTATFNLEAENRTVQ